MCMLLYLSADESGRACISAFSYLVMPHMQVDDSRQGREGTFRCANANIDAADLRAGRTKPSAGKE